MRVTHSLRTTLLLLPAAASLAAAQSSNSAGATEPIRLLGLSVAASGGPRDTLGLLVATVVRNGPADQAGITTGSRVLAVNGQAVRLSPNDIGRPRAADSVLARFDEAVRATSVGTDVTLRVVGGGRTRNVSLATAERRTVPGDTPVPTPPVVRAPAPVAPAVDSARSKETVGIATGFEASAPVTAAPVTAAPVTPAPVTAAPVTPAPVTPAPVTPAPTVLPTPTALDPSLPGVPMPALPASVAVTAMAIPAAIPSAPRPSAATPAATATTTSVMPRSLGAVVAALGDAQLDLRRLARDSQPLAVSDSLIDLEHDLAALRARLRRVQSARGVSARDSGSAPADALRPLVASTPAGTASAMPSVAAPPPTVPRATTVPSAPAAAHPGAGATRLTLAGLELTRVTGDLAVFLGAQADSALLVQQAGDAWEPLRAGDVVLKVDGKAPELTRVREALASQRPVALVVLRRGRTFTVAFGGAPQP